MPNRNQGDGSKRVKNIAAILYLLAMIFVVGGSYLNQRQDTAVASQPTIRPN